MHDPSAILAITDPNLFKFETMPMRVVCDGKEIGRTKRHEDGDRRKIKVAMDVKSEMARQNSWHLWPTPIASHCHERSAHR